MLNLIVAEVAVLAIEGEDTAPPDLETAGPARALKSFSGRWATNGKIESLDGLNNKTSSRMLRSPLFNEYIHSHKPMSLYHDPAHSIISFL